jgi:hypothetical protein
MEISVPDKRGIRDIAAELEGQQKAQHIGKIHPIGCPLWRCC